MEHKPGRRHLSGTPVIGWATCSRRCLELAAHSGQGHLVIG
ncbi:MAG TPA: hypothetical protein VLW50_05765 [Streptosporangiaceae bacterium]|nr:hypothetical protein [Streptosporangiaceae bacterium]